MTALICGRRPTRPDEYLSLLFGEDPIPGKAGGQALPFSSVVPVFADAAQQTRFVELWTRRWTQVVGQLDAQQTAPIAECGFLPAAVDMRGIVANLSDEQRAELGKDLE